MKNKGLLILLGFVLLVLGITSLSLQLVGVSWAFLEFLELGGRLVAFVVKILMVIVGIVIVVLANTNWEQERRDSNK